MGCCGGAARGDFDPLVVGLDEGGLVHRSRGVVGGREDLGVGRGRAVGAEGCGAEVVHQVAEIEARGKD